MTKAVALIAAALTLALIAVAPRYGYHRDELYFLGAGRHLSWGYADQGPLTPLVARAMSEISATSLTVLRLPSALAAGTTVLLTGLLARELGGGPRAQWIATSCAAAGALIMFDGHLLSTSTFDLLVWTTVSWLVVRAVRTGEDHLWPVAGVVLGVGLLNKPLPAFLAFGLLVGVVAVGPRRLLRSRMVWAGAVIALALWSPWLVWQAEHQWPQLDVSRSIARGGSTSSQPWWTIVPFQFLLISPVLAPIWLAGLVRLGRDPRLRAYRFLLVAWAALAVAFMATGGKPYYLTGLMPVLIAAGAHAADTWLEGGRRRARRVALLSALLAGAGVSALIDLPLLPERDTGPAIAMNADVAETIGWPQLVRTIAAVRDRLPAPTGQVVIFTGNYGEAGAIDRFGPALGLPRAYSGHNAYGRWGPPADGRAPVIVVGLTPRRLAAHFTDCHHAARIDNRRDVDNQEQGRLVMVCRQPRRAWSAEWPSLRHLG